MNHIASSARLGLLLLMSVPATALAQEDVRTQLNTIRVETLSDTLENPWAVEDMGNGGYLITERPGHLRIFRNGALGEPITGTPEVWANGQGGLLDVALAPDFADSRIIFLSYSKPGADGAGTAIARAKLSEDETGLENLEDIFVMNRFSGTSHHFGSRIAVAKDGSLFFTIGDRGEGERAQDAGDHAGSVLHINSDGTPGKDNPAANGWLPEIWSIGHRNPQGAGIDPETGTLYTVEHGARGGDELNRPEAGKNYGWPEISYGRHYSGAEIGQGTAAPGFEQPVYYWDPSIAPGGMTVYRGAMFPEWKGDIFVSALKYQLLTRLDMSDEDGSVLGEERILKGDYGRIRDVNVADDGAILLVTDEAPGKLLRISRPEKATE